MCEESKEVVIVSACTCTQKLPADHVKKFAHDLESEIVL